MQYINGVNRKINIKGLYNDIIELKTFDSKNLKLDKKAYKNLDIYNIGYVTIKKIGCGYDVNSVNPLYWRISNASGYIKEINKDKYLVFNDTDENKELLKIYDDVFSGIMSKIIKIDDDWLEYSKGYKKIKFNSDDILSLNKTLKTHTMTVTIRCVISEDNKLYPQVFLDGALYSL